ncbi:sensor histidine kinase [Bifidobacterium sp.]|uniref:sensor histidine kinase n=1 Tax=Bifidobacterium sp. TaxID=41200 RepID=UPI0039ED3A06
MQDIISGTVITVLFALVFSDDGYADGLLFRYSGWSIVPWTVMLGIPLTFRRKFPQSAALSFVAISFLQLILGPSAAPSDMAALILLYTVIVYGDPKNTHAFLWIAGFMGLLTVVEGAVSGSFKPLLMRQSTTESFACDATPRAFLNSGCLDSMKETSIVLGIAVAITLLSVVVMAYWQRARKHAITLLKERNQALISRQDEERQIAALAERARIARDMHDVVAHTLSSIIVQSDAGRYAGRHDLHVAETTMRNIETEGRTALAGMQSLLGVIDAQHGNEGIQSSAPRTEAADSSAATRFSHTESLSHTDGSTLIKDPTLINGSPQTSGMAAEAVPGRHADSASDMANDAVSSPNSSMLASIDSHASSTLGLSMPSNASATYGQIPLLISHANAMSPQSHVVRRVNGTPRPESLSMACQETMFRVVEESLSNVRKHAGPVVHVLIQETWSDTGISLTIRDDGRGKGASADGHRPGFGLRGMAERVEACNGSLESGPLPLGGFQIAVTLPISDGGEVTESGTRGISRRLRATFDLLRSQPLNIREIYGSTRPNAIERFSQWAQRHYVLVDTIGALVAWVCFLAIGMGNHAYLFYSQHTAQIPVDITIAVTSFMTLPLCARRRFPFASAMFVASCCTLQLIVVPGVLPVNILAGSFLSSALMYGKSTHTAKLMALAVVDSMLFGLQTYFATADIGRSLLDAMRDPNLVMTLDSSLRSVRAGLISAIALTIFCGGVAASGLWARSRGNNILVLQEREEAILLEQERQMVLSADNERNRIASAIQKEVTDTLMSVVSQAERGLLTIESLRRASVENMARENTAEKSTAEETADGGLDDPSGYGKTGTPTSESSFDEAFGAIGRQGRTALAHMRTLLGVLRTTGFSDRSPDAHGASSGQLPISALKPADSLDDQLRDAQARDDGETDMPGNAGSRQS